MKPFVHLHLHTAYSLLDGACRIGPLMDEVAKADSMSTILDIAYRLEVEAYDLFHGAIDMCDTDEGKKIFTELAKLEQGHMILIDEMRKKL